MPAIHRPPHKQFCALIYETEAAFPSNGDNFPLRKRENLADMPITWLRCRKTECWLCVSTSTRLELMSAAFTIDPGWYPRYICCKAIQKDLKQSTWFIIQVDWNDWSSGTVRTDECSTIYVSVMSWAPAKQKCGRWPINWCKNKRAKSRHTIFLAFIAGGNGARMAAKHESWRPETWYCLSAWGELRS